MRYVGRSCEEVSFFPWPFVPAICVVPELCPAAVEWPSLVEKLIAMECSWSTGVEGDHPWEG